MSFLPDYQPEKLSLGFLEQEILNIIWDLDGASAKDIHDKILENPERELAYASVMTVLQRLMKKQLELFLICLKQCVMQMELVWQQIRSV